MRVFITGGAGFIGSYLCRRLMDDGHQVTAYDNLSLGRRELIRELEVRPGFQFIEADLLDDQNLSERVRGHDLIIHLAANSDISLGSDKTDLDLKQGVLATYNLLEATRIAGGKRLIFASTSAIYGEASLKPTREDYGPLIPISFYGASKLSAESLVCAFAHHYGVQAWIYRFANVVGPNLTHGAIYDFAKRLAQEPTTLKVLGDGRQRKSYLHVTDCCDGMLFGLAHASAEVNIFNLASEGVTEVRFIAEEVCRQLAPKAKIEFGLSDRGWKGDVPFTWLSGEKLNGLGWRAKIDSDGAVKRSIAEVLR